MSLKKQDVHLCVEVSRSYVVKKEFVRYYSTIISVSR